MFEKGFAKLHPLNVIVAQMETWITYFADLDLFFLSTFCITSQPTGLWGHTTQTAWMNEKHYQ